MLHRMPDFHAGWIAVEQQASDFALQEMHEPCVFDEFGWRPMNRGRQLTFHGDGYVLELREVIRHGKSVV